MIKFHLFLSFAKRKRFLCIRNVDWSFTCVQSIEWYHWIIASRHMHLVHTTILDLHQVNYHTVSRLGGKRSPLEVAPDYQVENIQNKVHSNTEIYSEIFVWYSGKFIESVHILYKKKDPKKQKFTCFQRFLEFYHV